MKKEKVLKSLTPKKLLTRFRVLLAQMKAGNNSYKLRNEVRQIFCLLYNKIIKTICNTLIKSLYKFVILTEPKTAPFHLLKNIDSNLKNEIRLMKDK